MSISLRRLGAFTITLVAAAAFTAPAALASTAPVGAQVAAVRAATVAYHDVDVAIADGFVPTDDCVAGEDGAMGFHYVNFDRVFDGRIVPTEPEVLLYIPRADGTPRLVGVEYLSLAPTSLFGRTFEPGPGGTYALHAWIWQANPAGMFTGMNSQLSC